MRYIKFLKQQPKKQEIKIPQITEILSGLDQNGNVTLLAKGNNLPINKEYNWIIDFGDSYISPSTTSNLLVLSKNNSDKYKESSKISIIIGIDDYITDSISIK